MNWQGLGNALIGGAQSATNYSNQLANLAENQAKLDQQSRHDKAMLLKQDSLQKLGYDEKGMLWTKGDYQSASPDQRPAQLYEHGLDRGDKDSPQTKEYNQLVDVYGPEKAAEMYATKYKDPSSTPGADQKEFSLLVQQYGQEKARQMYATKYDKGGADKLLWTSDNKPITLSAYSSLPIESRPEVSDKPPKSIAPDVKPKEALKEIAAIDIQIGNLKKGNRLTSDGMESALKKMPELAPFMNMKTEMSPEDRQKAIASLMQYRDYLQAFVPTGGKGLAAPSMDTVSNPTEPQMVSSHSSGVKTTSQKTFIIQGKKVKANDVILQNGKSYKVDENGIPQEM